AGWVAPDDIVPESAVPAGAISPASTTDLEPTASLGASWTPTFVLAEAASSLMAQHGLEAISNGRYRRLPIAASERTANLVHWQEAIRQWYKQDTSPLDYRVGVSGRADAVLEVGIGTYQILDVQTPLQVLLKLVDPVSRRVIGRISVDAYPVRDSAEILLDHEAEPFKRQVAEIGARLIARGLSELGLPSNSRNTGETTTP
ncbi:MAG: hypothetical protein PHE55_11655, partial [Methylococcaceae bacterium]|nr:hypothetical protein [Methylococcaceae bacterium]